MDQPEAAILPRPFDRQSVADFARQPERPVPVKDDRQRLDERRTELHGRRAS